MGISKLYRVSAGTPWPRGICSIGNRIIVLGRGAHRNQGGPNKKNKDYGAGHLYEIDPKINEVVKGGVFASDRIKKNIKTYVTPSSPPFELWKQKGMGQYIPTDRPYATLIYDDHSKNFFICGYSGIDLPGKINFSKNAVDSILRYDTRSNKWYVVEKHIDTGEGGQGKNVDTHNYPHKHLPKNTPPPHGWLAGPECLCVYENRLYAGSLDNDIVVSYDLAEINKDPNAAPPKGKKVLSISTNIKGRSEKSVKGPSALAVHDGYLYAGYRTSSVIARFKLNKKGIPKKGQLIADFSTLDKVDIIDIAFDLIGNLYISTASLGGVWIIAPNEKQPFIPSDETPNAVDLRQLTKNDMTKCSNILIAKNNQIYICTNNHDTKVASPDIVGVVYRATITKKLLVREGWRNLIKEESKTTALSTVEFAKQVDIDPRTLKRAISGQKIRLETRDKIMQFLKRK